LLRVLFHQQHLLCRELGMDLSCLSIKSTIIGICP
jgi:hypothetical protein